MWKEKKFKSRHKKWDNEYPMQILHNHFGKIRQINSSGTTICQNDCTAFSRKKAVPTGGRGCLFAARFSLSAKSVWVASESPSD
uniref:Uncharacterized protein n=1 Tax=Elizabethkingia anophelis TaxID=1117645 RepID=A0A455ZF64_9FLAO|nr:TPA_exp: hypothetical protein [Elizabethkingia anophelis]